jgi:hypothetical protein
MKLLESCGLKKYIVQLASDGTWERAVNVAGCTRDWIEESGENIAIEVVYQTQSGELAGFLGFRKIISDPLQRCAFWQAVASNLLSCEYYSPITQTSIWLEELNLSCLSSTDPKYIELGVFNQWRSARTIRQTSNTFLLSGLLGAPPWLQEGAEAPICKEYVWELGDGFWVADNVSTRMNGRYYLSSDQPDEF